MMQLHHGGPSVSLFLSILKLTVAFVILRLMVICLVASLILGQEVETLRVRPLAPVRQLKLCILLIPVPECLKRHRLRCEVWTALMLQLSKRIWSCYSRAVRLTSRWLDM